MGIQAGSFFLDYESHLQRGPPKPSRAIYVHWKSALATCSALQSRAHVIVPTMVVVDNTQTTSLRKLEAHIWNEAVMILYKCNSRFHFFGRRAIYISILSA